MSNKTQPASKPTANRGGQQSDPGPANAANPKRDFFMAAANMSWQLAVVVLIPVMGGFKLDEKLHSLPLYTLIGFALAVAGMAVVIWRQLQLFAPTAGSPPKGSK